MIYTLKYLLFKILLNKKTSPSPGRGLKVPHPKYRVIVNALATDSLLFLRANGQAIALTRDEITNITGPIEPPTTNSTLPNGNSIQLMSIGSEGNDSNNKFNGSKIIFELRTTDNPVTLFAPISAANLLVSVGGVIQRPEIDYEILDSSNSASGSTRNRIRFNGYPEGSGPSSTLSCFIIALGGLGGLRQNLDWGANSKGYLLAGTATANTGAFITPGSNGQVLTVDDTTGTSTGLMWQTIPRDALKTNPAWDAKGDLLVGTSADTAGTLAVSASNGAILTVDSSTATGLAWKTSINTTGIITASSFKTSTASTGFLKADGTVDTNTYITQAVPVGSVFHFASSTPPTGYLKANGNTVTNGVGTVQGITADFSALYAILGSTYGSAGKLPDLRGEFIRGWVDDRTGLGTQVGFGQTQDWAIENITGAYAGESRGSGGGAFADVQGGDGGFNGGGAGPTSWDFDASRVVKTSTETRPRNVALLACIKY